MYNSSDETIPGQTFVHVNLFQAQAVITYLLRLCLLYTVVYIRHGYTLGKHRKALKHTYLAIVAERQLHIPCICAS